LNRIRTLIVDDEPAARRGLLRLLRNESDVDVVGECEDGVEALAVIQAQRPDLVFLDIQMPRANGLDVAQALLDDSPPAIVFVTAFDEHALAAFDVHAVDYVLKPIEPDRLREAIERARQRIRGTGNSVAADLSQALAALQTQKPARWATRLPVRGGGRVVLVDVARITRIEASGNNVVVHTGKGNPTQTMRDTLTAVESKLDPAVFVRISRSIVVNRERIAEIHPLFDGDFVIVLDDGTNAPGSRRYRAAIEAWLR
jgi:two-component system LytT family response regulator